jgi:hypothetical protein
VSNYPNHKTAQNWIKLHKKTLIVHSAVVVIFLLFLLFVSDPLFKSLQGSRHIIQLQNISLPLETNNINWGLDRYEYNSELLEIEGFAFIEGYNTENNQIFVVLKSYNQTYVFNTIPNKRNDVTQAYSTLNLNLDDSGFKTFIPRDKIAENGYNMGICIIKGDVQAFEYTNRLLQDQAKLQTLSLSMETENITYSIDSFIVNDNVLEVKGWAFINGQSSENSQIYLVLKSKTETYVFSSIPISRIDVTTAFIENNLNYNNSGFDVVLNTGRIPKNKYTAGIYIKKGSIEALQYTEYVLGNESMLQNINLPLESNNIRYSIDIIDIVNNNIEVKGWAFIDGQDAEKNKIYLVLKSATQTYVFDTISNKRADVTRFFSESNLNLENSGFLATIPDNSLIEGRYTLGLYIQNETGVLTFTDKVYEKP